MSYAVVQNTDEHISQHLGHNDVEQGTNSKEIELIVGDSESTRARAPTFSPTVQDNAPSVLSFTNLNVTTRNVPKKILLNNVSGSISGGMWAIMGPSGSGKTTLLSTLSLRLDSNYMEINGEFRLNGREYSRHVLKAMSAYVMQDDLLHAELTVEETLSYASQLRMPSSCTSADREKRVDEVLKLMGIEYTRKTIIGNSRRKGISGGERKRVAIAIEILNRPVLLFLDEPTSGLDSTTALSVCQALKNLAAKGECTVVCTIHQPQPKIFNLFDNLILMKKGEIVYHGAISKTHAFVESLGHPLPEDTAIADFLLDVISQNNEEFGEEKTMVIPVDLSLGIDKAFYSKSTDKSWLNEFQILFRRNFHQYIRNVDIIIMNLCVSVLLAVFIGCGLWHQIGHGQDSIAKRVPSLFFACITQGIVGSLQAVNSFPSERAIMLRERQAGTYSVSSYYVAKSAVDILTQLWPPIIFSCIVYPLIGYQNRADKFFYYMFFMCLNCVAATSLATMVSCICVSIELSTIVLSLCFEICRLYGGFFASPARIREYPHWIWTSCMDYINYAFIGITLNELTGLDIDCDTGSTCAITSGEQIIKANDYDEYTLEFCIGILFVLIFGYRLIGYIALRYLRF